MVSLLPFQYVHLLFLPLPSGNVRPYSSVLSSSDEDILALSEMLVGGKH